MAANTFPLVSVVIATYNRSALLGRAIDSIFCQTYPNLELIVVNDNSPDDTNALLDSYESRHPSLKTIRLQQNVGPGRARNLAISQARGKYVAIMDDDDICVETRLEKQVQFMEGNPHVDLCFSLVQWMDEALKPIGVLPGKLKRGIYPEEASAIFTQLLLENIYIPNQTRFGKRDLFLRYPYAEDVRGPEDWYQVLAMAANGVCIRGIPEVLVWVDRSGSRDGLMVHKQKLFVQQRIVIRRIAGEARLSRWICWKAFSNQCVREARAWSRWRGLGLLLQALALNPTNRWAYQTMGEIILRGLKKLQASHP